MSMAAVVFGLYLFGVANRWPAYAGFAVQCVYLVSRGLTLGRVPLIGVHDTVSFLAASVMAFGIAVDQAQGRKRGVLNAVSGMAAAFALAALFQAPYAKELPPVLKTYWFELHVATSFMAYALFGIAAILGVYFLRTREAEAEQLQYKVIFTGYALFSLSMIFGGVWAFLAWGTYWLWTPKELWTSLLWLYYGLYLHLRYIKWWQGRPAAVLGIIGFGVVMFTYLGVSLLMKSSHSF
jgi:ABC-type transport system involved in cytochrome c biogenesis permease subunit